MTRDEALARVEARRALCSSLKQVIVERLDLPLEPDWITDDQALFGRGLELDSVDALDLVVGIEQEFHVSVTDDDIGAFGSINALADFVQAQLGEDAPVGRAELPVA